MHAQYKMGMTLVRRKIAAMWVCALMIASAFVMVAEGKEIGDSPMATPVFLDVYTSPRYPLGADWDTGLGGDIITVFANVTNVLNNDVWVTWYFANRLVCMPDAYDVMTHVSGTLYKFVLPGDSFNGWNVFGESYTTNEHIGIRLDADPTDGIGSMVTYPAPGDWHYIYPAIQPNQINATSVLSKTTMSPGETFWVNGTSNYWNSTSYPNDFSQLFPADECPVTINVGSTPFNSKTDIGGNYSIMVTAPATPGTYMVNTTVSNATANRNVPCLCGESQIVVMGTGLTPHAPIRINSNADFDEAHGVTNWATGNGTEGNPWIIENYNIDGGSYGYCIYIGNVTEHFTIQYCNITNATNGMLLWHIIQIVELLYRTQKMGISIIIPSSGIHSQGFSLIILLRTESHRIMRLIIIMQSISTNNRITMIFATTF